MSKSKLIFWTINLSQHSTKQISVKFHKINVVENVIINLDNISNSQILF